MPQRTLRFHYSMFLVITAQINSKDVVFHKESNYLSFSSTSIQLPFHCIFLPEFPNSCCFKTNLSDFTVFLFVFCLAIQESPLLSAELRVVRNNTRGTEKIVVIVTIDDIGMDKCGGCGYGEK